MPLPTVISGFKFVHLNCRSLFRKIDQIAALYNNFDMICCTETWLNDSHTVSMLAIPNMTLYRLNRSSKRGGGVCIYVANRWAQYVKLDHVNTISTSDFEVITILLNKPHFRKLSISCVYRPPVGKSTNCLEFLKSLLNTNITLNFELWLLGDFNIDYLVRDNNDTKSFLSTFKTAGLKQLISDITRPHRNGGTCIDWVVTSSPFIKMSGICDHMISDHFPIYCVRKKKRESHTAVHKEARDYSKYNLANLRTLLLNLNWDMYNASQDPNVMYEFIVSNLYKILEIMCPLRKFKQRLESARWMKPDIHKAIKTRKFYVTLFKLTRLDKYLKLSHIWRNKVNVMVDNAKSDYIKSELDRNAKNPKKFWRIINSFLDNKCSSLSDINFLDPETDAFVPRGSEANYLNNYFVNIATRLGMHPDINLADVDLVTYNYDHPLLLEEIDVDVHEVKNLAKVIDVTKSSCIVNINSRICKDVLIMIPDPFSRLFNISLGNGIFPRKWAQGIVNVIPKGGDLNQP